MKNVEKFDVVKLNNGNKATILDTKNSKYLAEEVTEEGKSLGTKEISSSDIKNVIFSHKY